MLARKTRSFRGGVILHRAAIQALESRQYLTVPVVTDVFMGMGAFTENGDCQIAINAFDPDQHPITSLQLDWGDGSDVENYESSDFTHGSLDTDDGEVSGWLFDHYYLDNGSYTLTVTPTDGDNESASYTFAMVVSNLIPEGTLSNSGPINEGQEASVSFNDATDASPIDTDAGLRYSFATDPDDLATTYNDAGTDSSASIELDDSGVHTIYGRVFDKDDGYADDSTNVTVVNVAPMATLSATQSETGFLRVQFSGVSDPSPADASAGFKYAFSTDYDALQSINYSTASGTAYADFDFSDSGTQTVYARIFDQDGSRPYDTTLHLPPLSVAVASSSQINLTWTDTATGETGWRVQRSTNGTSFSDYVNLDPNTDHYEWTGLDDGTRYWFRVRAYGTPGTASDTIYSPKMADTTQLAAPGNPTVTPVSSNEIDLSWTNSSVVESGYKIYRSTTSNGTFDLIATTDPNVTSYHNTGLDDGTAYYYYIETYKSGLSPVDSTHVSATTILPEPSDLTVSDIHGNQATVSWSTNSEDQTGFLLERATGGGSFDWSVTVDPDTNYFVVTGLDVMTSYRFRVTALGHSINSDPSSTSDEITTLPPTVIMDDPIYQPAISVDDDFFHLELDYETPTLPSGSTAHVVLEDAFNGQDFQQMGTYPWPQFGHYAINIDGSDGSFSTFRMYAVVNGVNSDYSNEVSVSVAPMFPANIGVDQIEANSVRLYWNDGSSQEAGYQVQIIPDDDSTDPWTESLPAGSTSLTVQGLEEGAGYEFDVTSFNDGGSSFPVTIHATTTVAAPTDLEVDAPNPVSANLTWDDNSQAEDAYLITYWPTADADPQHPDQPPPTAQAAIAPANATGFPIIGLTPDTGYTFQLKADKGAVYSDAATATVSTPAVDDEDDFPPGDPNEPPPPPIYDPDTELYRWVLTGSVFQSGLHNEGDLYLSDTNWHAGTPPGLDFDLVSDLVSGSITTSSDGTNDPPFWIMTVSHSFPNDASETEGAKSFWVTTSSSHADIYFEDSFGWGTDGAPSYDLNYGEGYWSLDLATMTVGADGPSTDPYEPPENPPPHPPLPVVYIQTMDGSGSESPDSGQSSPGPITFRVGRWGDLSSSLSVQLFDPAGTTNGDDYSGLPTSVTIPEDEDHVDVTVTPVDDEAYEGTENVFAILKASANYWLSTAFMAGAQITDNDPKISIDSNNDGNIDKRDDAIKDDSSKPGKIVAVNDDDTDGDGIPDYADGYGLVDNAAANVVDGEQFVPVHLQLPDGVDPDNATFRISYDGSNPETADVETDPETGETTFTLPDGSLRLWAKPGDEARDGHGMEDDGDYITPDTTYDWSTLSNSAQATLWLEAVKPSQALADGRIVFEVDRDGVSSGDAVRTTAFSMHYASIDENENLTPVDDVEISIPSPTITVTDFELENLRFNDDKTAIIGDLHVEGTLDDQASDLIAGEDGTISSISLLAGNSSTPVSITTTVTKSSGEDSLLKPFDFSATFDQTISDIELEPGTNAFHLLATNAYGYSGYADFSADVDVTPPDDQTTNIELDFSDDPYLNSGAVTITAKFQVNGGSWNSVLLQRSNTDPTVFQDVLGAIMVNVGPDQIFHSGSADETIVTVTNPDAGLSGEPVFVKETGNATFNMTGTAEITAEDRPDYTNYTLAAGDKSGVTASTGGDFHPYVLEFDGPGGLFSSFDRIVGEGANFPIGLGPDGVTHMAMEPDGSRVATLLLKPIDLNDHVSLPPIEDHPLTVKGAAELTAGIVVGFTQGGVDFVVGTAKFIKGIPSGIGTAYHYLQNLGIRYVNGDTFETERTIAAKAWTGITVMSEIVSAIMANDDAVIEAVYSGSYEPLNNLSPETKAAIECTVELLQTLAAKFDNLSDYEQGKIAGNLIFQVESLLVGGQVASMGKAAILAKLSKLPIVAESAEVAAAVNEIQPLARKIDEVVTAAGVAAGSPEARELENLLSFYERAKSVDGLDPWPALKKVLEATAGDSAAVDAALADTMDTAMPEIYKAAINADGTTDLSKIPTAKDLYQAMGAVWDENAFGGKGAWVGGRHAVVDLQNHHTAVIGWTEKLLGRVLTQAEKDAMPGYIMRTKLHQGKKGTAAFHAILRALITDGKSYDQATILSNLEQAYTAWDPEAGPSVWAVARQWLRTMGIQ